MARDICIDGSFLARRYTGCGTNRYLVNLLRQMSGIAVCGDELNLRVLLPSARDARRCGLDDGNGFTAVSCPPMRLAKIWRLGLFLNIITVTKLDMVFLPSPLPIYFKPRHLAVTVHDVIPLLFADQHKSLSGRTLRLSFLSSLRKADLIFTDSEHSRNDMVSIFGIPSERIAVTYLGIDSQLFNPVLPDPAASDLVLKQYGISRPYLLHVGVIEPRKNLVRLVRAFHLFASRKKSFQFQLVLCGRLGWDFQELLDLVNESDLKARVILTGAVSDSDLALLYKSSQGCIMASLYEGFGLPLLEAMASGVPVISSNRSCLPEIGGDAVLYFDPESIEEMALAMERLLSDSSLREESIGKGLKRAAQFTWEDCARKTLAALREL